MFNDHIIKQEQYKDFIKEAEKEQIISQIKKAEKEKSNSSQNEDPTPLSLLDKLSLIFKESQLSSPELSK